MEICILRFLQEPITGVQGVISSIRKGKIPMIKSWPIIARITLVDIILIRLKEAGVDYLIIYWTRLKKGKRVAVYWMWALAVGFSWLPLKKGMEGKGD